MQPHTLGQRIAMLRARHKITQTELAQKTGISQTTLSNIELGSQNETAERIASIARALHTTPDFLLGVVQEPEELAPGAWLIDLDEYERLKSGGKPQLDETWAAAIPSRPSVVSSQMYDQMRRSLAPRKKK